jgi:hypothetical protein
MANQNPVLFVKGISSALSDIEIRELICTTFSRAELFDQANDPRRGRNLNNYLSGTVNNVIVKRPKFSSAHAPAQTGFINAVVYFEQISFDKMGPRNFDSLNNGGFIKIIFCPSTATSPVKYWKVFKYDGDRTRINSFATFHSATEFSKCPCYGSTTVSGNFPFQQNNFPNVTRNNQTNNNNNNNNNNNAIKSIRHEPNRARISMPETNRIDSVDIRHVHLVNTVVSRKYPVPKPNVNSKYYEDDGEDDSGMIM